TATGAPHWPGYVSDLGTALEDRFGATGDLVDLDAAITAHEQGLEAGAPVKADRPMILHHLAGALRQRFRLTRYPGDLQAAAASAKEAVHECQAADPNRPLYLTSLGNTLFERYRATIGSEELPAGIDGPSDLEKALDAFREAVSTVP